MNGTNNTPIYDQLMADRERTIVVPLVDTSTKRTQQVLSGLGFYQPLQQGIRRAIDAEARAHHAYFAPVGTPLDSPAWESIGYLSQDGIQLDTGQDEIREWGGDLIRTTTSFEETFTFEAEKSNRHVLKLVFGVYRHPGDRPLIHKGRKP